MEDEQAHSRVYRAFALLTIFTLTLALQIASGAYQSEFGSHPDEPAHVLTGLMVHDYLATPTRGAPLPFAEDYYIHYPKVAIGHWPPFFYVVQAAWYSAFGVGGRSVLLLMASLSALLAWTVFLVARKHAPFPIPFLAALSLITLPIMQQLTSAVMIEVLQSLLVLIASVTYGKYLEQKRPWTWAIIFALLASLCILTKGTGLILALVPLFALLFTGKWSLLRAGHFWLPAVIVFVLCAPFYLATLSMQRNGMVQGGLNLPYVLEAASFYSRSLLGLVGLLVCLPALLGLAWSFLPARADRTSVEPRSAALAAMLISALLFYVVVPCGLEQRHLAITIPPLAFFAVVGLSVVSRWMGGVLANHRAGLVVVALATPLCFAPVYEPYRKDWRGFLQLVDDSSLRDDSSFRGDSPRIPLIVSDSIGEGMAVTAWAFRDQQRPTSYVLRGSKMLSTQTWDGGYYALRFGSADEVRRFLISSPISEVVIDGSVPDYRRQEHEYQMEAVAVEFPELFELRKTYSVTRDGVVHHDALRVYTVKRDNEAPYPVVEIDMRYMLGRTLSGVTK